MVREAEILADGVILDFVSTAEYHFCIVNSKMGWDGLLAVSENAYAVSQGPSLS